MANSENGDGKPVGSTESEVDENPVLPLVGYRVLSCPGAPPLLIVASPLGRTAFAINADDLKAFAVYLHAAAAKAAASEARRVCH